MNDEQNSDAASALRMHMKPTLDLPRLRVEMQNLHWQGYDVDSLYERARRGDETVPPVTVAWELPLPKGYLDWKDEIMAMKAASSISLAGILQSVTLPLSPDITSSLTPQERELLESFVRTEGDDWVRKHWGLVIDQARWIGYLD